jgi:soluble cytochrome b562
MKSQTIASALLLSLLVAAPTLRAQDNGAAPAAPAPDASAAPQAAPAAEDKTDLEKQMDIINKAFRKLRGQIKDASQNAASIALVGQIHDAATAALDLTPKKEKDLPDADQAKFHADFQAGLKDFITQVDALTAALTANDNDQAATLLQQLGQTERKDHKQFKKVEKKD